MAYDVALERASTFITLDASAEFADGNTITIGGKTYTAKATLTDTDGFVHIGAAVGDTLDNLVAAVNISNEGESAVGAGTDYAASTTRNPRVYAVKDSATVIKFYSHVPGEIGNAIGVANGTSTVTVDNATLENGSGNIADFFDGIFELNQVPSELIEALSPFSRDVSGDDGTIGTA